MKLWSIGVAGALTILAACGDVKFEGAGAAGRDEASENRRLVSREERDDDDDVAKGQECASDKAAGTACDRATDGGKAGKDEPSGRAKIAAKTASGEPADIVGDGSSAAASCACDGRSTGEASGSPMGDGDGGSASNGGMGDGNDAANGGIDAVGDAASNATGTNAASAIAALSELVEGGASTAEIIDGESIALPHEGVFIGYSHAVAASTSASSLATVIDIDGDRCGARSYSTLSGTQAADVTAACVRIVAPGPHAVRHHIQLDHAVQTSLSGDYLVLETKTDKVPASGSFDLGNDQRGEKMSFAIDAPGVLVMFGNAVATGSGAHAITTAIDGTRCSAASYVTEGFTTAADANSFCVVPVDAGKHEIDIAAQRSSGNTLRRVYGAYAVVSGSDYGDGPILKSGKISASDKRFEIELDAAAVLVLSANLTAGGGAGSTAVVIAVDGGKCGGDSFTTTGYTSAADVSSSCVMPLAAGKHTIEVHTQFINMSQVDLKGGYVLLRAPAP